MVLLAIAIAREEPFQLSAIRKRHAPQNLSKPRLDTGLQRWVVLTVFEKAFNSNHHVIDQRLRAYKDYARLYVGLVFVFATIVIHERNRVRVLFM